MNSSESIVDFRPDQGTVTKSIFNSIIIQVVFKLKGLITVPIMTYYLVPKEMGIYNLIVVTVSLLAPLFCMNLIDGPAVYLMQEKSKDRIKDMYNTVVNGSMVFFLVCALIFWRVLKTYGGEKYRFLLLILLTMFSLLFYKVFSYILVVFQKTAWLVKNTFYKDGSAVVLSLLLVMAGLSYYALLSATIATEIIAGLFIYFLIRRDLPYRMFIDWKILLTFLKISLPLLPVFVFTWIVQSSDSYFLAYYKGAGTVGKYTIIYGLSSIVLTLNYVLNMFWYPISAKLWIENREKYRETFVSVFTALAAFLFILVLAFEFNSKVILRIFARNPEYQDSYVIMGTIALAFALQVLITLLTAPLYSNRNPYAIFVSYLFGGLVNVLLNFLLIPRSGIVGAAISTAASYLVIVVAMSYFSYKVARFSCLDKRLIYVCGGFAALWAGVAYLREHALFYQLIIADVVLFTGIATLIYLRVLTKNERDFISSFLKGFSLRTALKT